MRANLPDKDFFVGKSVPTRPDVKIVEWIASGNDGQMLKIDRDGNVLGAIGNGRGTGPGQFMETDFMALGRQGNVYSGDTTVARITEMVAPKR